eukprot:7253678-Prymnesium_polylepis.1
MYFFSAIERAMAWRHFVTANAKMIITLTAALPAFAKGEPNAFAAGEPMTSEAWREYAQQANSNCLNGPCHPGNEFCGKPFENAPKFHLMDQHGCKRRPT